MRITGLAIKQKDRFLYVRSNRPESCEHCSNSGICNKKSVEICAYNDIGAEPGDWVVVETNEDKYAPRLFAYLFLTPIVIFFLACYLYTFFPWLALLAIPMLVAYYVVLRKINASHPVRARVVAPAAPPVNCAETENS